MDMPIGVGIVQKSVAVDQQDRVHTGPQPKPRRKDEAGGERQLLTGDDLLHERNWERPLTRLSITHDGQSQALLSLDAPALRLPIAREWVQPRWRIELADGVAAVAVDFDENGIGSAANP